MVYPFSEISFSPTRELGIEDACQQHEENLKTAAEKADARDHRLYESVYIKFPK